MRHKETPPVGAGGVPKTVCGDGAGWHEQCSRWEYRVTWRRDTWGASRDKSAILQAPDDVHRLIANLRARTDRSPLTFVHVDCRPVGEWEPADLEAG